MCSGWQPLACLPAYISENLAVPRPSKNPATTLVEPQGHCTECRGTLSQCYSQFVAAVAPTAIVPTAIVAMLAAVAAVSCAWGRKS